MTGVNEVRAAETFIHNRLAAQAGLTALVGDRIYRGKTPEGAALPCVVFSFVTSPDRQEVAGERIFTRPIYIVKAIGAGDGPETVADIATEIDKALNKAPAASPVTGITVMGCYRLEIVNIQEAPDNITYYHIGGQYRLFIQQT